MKERVFLLAWPNICTYFLSIGLFVVNEGIFIILFILIFGTLGSLLFDKSINAPSDQTNEGHDNNDNYSNDHPWFHVSFFSHDADIFVEFVFDFVTNIFHFLDDSLEKQKIGENDFKTRIMYWEWTFQVTRKVFYVRCKYIDNFGCERSTVELKLGNRYLNSKSLRCGILKVCWWNLRRKWHFIEKFFFDKFCNILLVCFSFLQKSTRVDCLKMYVYYKFVCRFESKVTMPQMFVWKSEFYNFSTLIPSKKWNLIFLCLHLLFTNFDWE